MPSVQSARRRAAATNEELPVMMEFVLDQAQQAGLGGHALFQIELAVEEILTNIIKYAYAESQGDMAVECGLGPEGFWLVFRDQGPAFNPLEVDEPALDATVQERQVGGLGLFLVRKFMDQVEYQRQGEDNVLRVVKRAAPGLEDQEPVRN
jgi:anti-sigma regulatory factor (Ser/Thr protein kinase)